MNRWLVCGLAIASPAIPGFAQETASAAKRPTIAAKTPVVIEFLQSLDSKTSKPGDRFAIRLAEPIPVEGADSVPSGAIGEGEVVHSARARAAGKAGELIVNARFVQCGAIRIPLGYLHVTRVGATRAGEAFAVSTVVPFGGFLVSGGNVSIPAGTQAAAKVAAAVSFDTPSLPGCGELAR